MNNSSDIVRDGIHGVTQNVPPEYQVRAVKRKLAHVLTPYTTSIPKQSRSNRNVIGIIQQGVSVACQPGRMGGIPT